MRNSFSRGKPTNSVRRSRYRRKTPNYFEQRGFHRPRAVTDNSIAKLEHREGLRREKRARGRGMEEWGKAGARFIDHITDGFGIDFRLPEKIIPYRAVFHLNSTPRSSFEVNQWYRQLHYNLSLADPVYGASSSKPTDDQPRPPFFSFSPRTTAHPFRPTLGSRDNSIYRC